MFSKTEAADIRKLFWTAFGRFMTRHLPGRGPKIKWLNYKTAVKNIYFRCHADNKVARVSIELQHSDPGIRELFYEQFLELEDLLHNQTDTVWTWEPEHYQETGQAISRIFVEIPGINIYNQDTWSKAFHFFESLMIPLDELWTDAVDMFDDLAN